MKKHLLLVIALALMGCTTIVGVAGKVAGPLPNQATTLAQAVQVADLATNFTHATVDAVKFPRATLVELSALNDGLHAAVVSLERANANGQSLNFATFNAALSAYNAYAVSQGIKP